MLSLDWSLPRRALVLVMMLAAASTITWTFHPILGREGPFLFGLLAVELAVSMKKTQGAELTHILAACFLAVSFFFVYRSFYGMRIEK